MRHILEYEAESSSNSLLSVKRARKGFARKRPIAMKITERANARKSAEEATAFASSVLPSPRRLERRLLTPTPVPTAAAIRRFWSGNARDTAVRAV